MTEQTHTPNSENVDQLTIAEKFFNHQFVGQIYGRNKWRVNEFITKLNTDSDSSTKYIGEIINYKIITKKISITTTLGCNFYKI